MKKILLFLFISISYIYAVEVTGFIQNNTTINAGAFNNLVIISPNPAGGGAGLVNIENAVGNNDTVLIFKVHVNPAIVGNPTNAEITAAILQVVCNGYGAIGDSLNFFAGIGGGGVTAYTTTLSTILSSGNDVMGRDSGGILSNPGSNANAEFLAVYQKPVHTNYNNARKNASSFNHGGFANLTAGKVKNQGIYNYQSQTFANVAGTNRTMVQYCYHTEAKYLAKFCFNPNPLNTFLIPNNIFNVIGNLKQVHGLSFSKRDMCPLCTSFLLRVLSNQAGFAPSSFLANQPNVPNAHKNDYNFVVMSGTRLSSSVAAFNALPANALNQRYDFIRTDVQPLLGNGHALNGIQRANLKNAVEVDVNNDLHNGLPGQTNFFVSYIFYRM